MFGALVKKNKENQVLPTFDSFFNEFDNIWENSLIFPQKAKDFNFLRSEKEDIIEISVPGVKKEEISIFLDENRKCLSVSGETKNKNQNSFGYMKFSKEFCLNNMLYDAENIDAKLNDGILKIILPLKKKRERARTIEIKT